MGRHVNEKVQKLNYERIHTQMWTKCEAAKTKADEWDANELRMLEMLKDAE